MQTFSFRENETKMPKNVLFLLEEFIALPKVTDSFSNWKTHKRKRPEKVQT